MIIKHGKYNFWEIHEVRKGLWAFYLDCAFRVLIGWAGKVWSRGKYWKTGIVYNTKWILTRMSFALIHEFLDAVKLKEVRVGYRIWLVLQSKLLTRFVKHDLHVLRGLLCSRKRKIRLISEYLHDGVIWLQLPECISLQSLLWRSVSRTSDSSENKIKYRIQ